MRRTPSIPTRSIAERVAARFVQAVLEQPFDGNYLLRLKRDAEIFLRNYDRVESKEDHARLFSTVVLWAKPVRQAQSALMRYLSNAAMSDPQVKNYDRQMNEWRKRAKPLSDLLLHIYPPSEWNDWPSQRHRWKERLSQAIEGLPEMARWLDGLRKRRKLTPAIPDTSERNMTLEGFRATLIGFDPDDKNHVDGLSRLREGLRQYKDRARHVFPQIVHRTLPLVVRFDVEDGLFGRAGQHGDGFTDIYPLNIRSVDEVVHTIAHETAHHFGLDLIDRNARAFWSRAINGDIGELDLRDVLRQWPASEPIWQFEPRIKQEDPILYLQLQSITQGFVKTLPRELADNWTRESIEAYLAGGGSPKVRVHMTPITAYGTSNPDEAFAEAISFAITYGPRTVHPKIRELLRIVLPGQFKAGASRDR